MGSEESSSGCGVFLCEIVVVVLVLITLVSGSLSWNSAYQDESLTSTIAWGLSAVAAAILTVAYSIRQCKH